MKLEVNSKLKEYNNVLEFLISLNKLLEEDKYLSRKNYNTLITQYNTEYEFFTSLIKANLLSDYAKKNKINKEKIIEFLKLFKDFEYIIESHNEEYLKKHLESEKNYLDNILKDVDKNIYLDEEQRRVVLTDEDYSLVVAGAGAGKTTTVAAKVKYLVEKKNILPSEILIISFTNKAVDELKEKINEDLKIDCPITTFHSSGNAILRKKDNEKKNVATEGLIYNVINKYLTNRIMNNNEMVEKLVQFFGSYFELPYEGIDKDIYFSFMSSKDFSTLKSNIGDYNLKIINQKTGKKETINNEIVRSIQEVKIANFLYLNGIDYEYEAVYPYHILQAKKLYTPDFKLKQGNLEVYLEHFGITEYGSSNFYSEEELKKYKESIKTKIAIHKKHNTKLIYTFSKYKDNRSIIEHLKELLIEQGFKFQKKSSIEVFQKLVSKEDNKYISKFVKLMCVFISNFKTNGYNLEDFEKLRKNANVRSKLFLDIAEACYLEYQRILKEYNALDFQDMINDSARILKEKQIAKEKLNFKYIIVDEYQDISRQRFNLTKELSNLCDAKIMAVGDDWQSIYAFSGSDISLFTKFTESFGYAKNLKITKTYRNSQEIIDIAGNFIQKNDAQIKKSLISLKNIVKPVIINTYSENIDRKKYKGKGGKYYALGRVIEEQIGDIIKRNKKENKNKLISILLLGRFNFDARNMCYSSDFVYNEQNGIVISKKYPNVKLTFMTAHSSKGLGFDNVIIVNAKNEIYGFPSKIESDPVLHYVTKFDSSFIYAEERRLFYVAMTRTKNRVYIVTPEEHPSEFILELIKDYPEILVNGKINKNSNTNVGYIKTCPKCSYPLRLRINKNYGMKLWECTNEPEICNYLSNEIAGDLTIQKCDYCCNGYLIVKRKNGKHFLGCTNYKKDGTGCNRTISYDTFLSMKNYPFSYDRTYNKIKYEKEVKNLIKDITLNKEKIKKDVHKTEYKNHTIEKDGFLLITDDKDNIITDINLLKVLRDKRMVLSKTKKIPAYTIINNAGLVSLATFKPTSKEEFISLSGLGKKTYEKYGKNFMEEIKKNYENS